MKLHKPLFVLSLIFCSAGALAQDCQNAVTTPELNECAAQQQKEVEANLNQVYQRVLKTVDSRPLRTQFVAAQRAWVKFRGADCKAVHLKHADGSIRTMMYLGCMQNHATLRIKQLEDFEGAQQ